MAETFIGRERERAELLAGLEDAVAGRGGIFLLAGEPGIGKTALAEHIGGRAEERGARVVWSRSWEGGGAGPYWTWAQIVRALADALDDDILRSLLSPDVASIALLAPELADRFGEAPRSIGPPDSAAGRFYLFEATSRFLREATAAQPLALVLDDILAGDRPSLLLLRFLARDVRASRLLVVATYRDVEAAGSAEAVDVLADLAAEAHLIRLRGLDRQEVARLVEEVSGTRPWEGKVNAIHEATAGNPLFVREVTRLLADEDRLDVPGRLSIPIPETVRAVIRRRLAPLSADAVQVLSAAAVVGRDFDLSLVSPSAERPTEQVLASLSAAVALGVVAAVPETVGVYRFTHPLIREAIYEALPIPARVQLHRRIGEAIERRYGTDAGSHLGALAHHFAHVAATGDASKAVEYARRAGDQAMDSYAYEDAMAHYRRALEALGFAGPEETLRCELLLRLGRAQARAGDYEEAKGSFTRAAEMARRLELPEQLARAALGFGEPQVEGGLVDRQLLALLQEALDTLDTGDSALRARALARFSLELTFSDDERLRDAVRDDLSRQALSMAERLGDVPALGLARRARWMAVWGPDGLEERSALSDDMLRSALETDDRDMELVARVRRITCSMERGDISAVDTDMAAHARLAAELRMPYHEWTSTTLRAGRALLDGSLGAAEELAEEASSRLPGRPNAALALLNQVTAIRWEQGRLGELREAWQGLVGQFPQAAFGRGWLALADADLGREDDGRRTLRSVVEEIPALPRGGLWLGAVATASLAAARLEEPDAAATLYPLLLPYAGRSIVIPMPHPVICFGSAALYLALLATASSRWEEAAEHFEEAIRANTRLGARSFLARTQQEYASMLLRRGGEADGMRASELLDRAAAAAGSLGLSTIAEATERLRGVEAAPILPPEGGESPPSTRAETNVFRREGDYWTVVYDGSVVRLRDSKGLRHLARLLAEPGREFHAVDLEAAGSSGETAATSAPGVRTQGLETRADLGDAGELLDTQAKAAYKRRLDDLRSELEEAESFNDPERAAKVREEMGFLADELARAVGLGGRDRRAASHTERARLNVTRAMRAAMSNLARANPSLGRHLSSTIRTGRYCSYTPDPRAPIVWES